MDLDDFDRKLLALMQEDAGQTADRLSETVGLSPSAIQRRLRRLRESGVILRDISVVAPEHVGRPTFFVTSLQVEQERPELIQQLRRWLSQQPQIQQVYYVTGEADFVMLVTARDTASYDAMMQRLLQENPNVRRFTTNVVLGTVKRGLAIPIPPRDDA